MITFFNYIINVYNELLAMINKITYIHVK